MRFILSAVKAFVFIFSLAVFFSIATAPMFFGLVFVTATAIGGAIVYALIGSALYTAGKVFRSRKAEAAQKQ